MYTYTCMQTYMHTYVYIYIYTYTYIHTHVYVYTSTHQITHHDELGSTVPQSAHFPTHGLRFGHEGFAGQTKVTDFKGHVAVDEEIARFQIAVHDVDIVQVGDAG